MGATEKLTYAAWTAIQLRDAGKENDQDARAEYWSKSGRIEKYDEYLAYCKADKKQPDNPPEGYWESKEKPWHKPAGVTIGLMGVLVWFAAGLIGGATGRSR